MDAATSSFAPAHSSIPQHIEALARANRVRLTRAALKRSVAAGNVTAADVVRTCPWEAETMKLIELLTSQRRWGRTRARKLLNDLRLREHKPLGDLTDRQRGELALALEARAAPQPGLVAEPADDEEREEADTVERERALVA